MSKMPAPCPRIAENLDPNSEYFHMHGRILFVGALHIGERKDGEEY